ncbi:methyltransferase-like protein 27 [Magallana gigas]|uniref:methyltransferase-like protein 27 n=1 Tax=Magallana gigas TaxID=29159 RepID=UPI003341F0AA
MATESEYTLPSAEAEVTTLLEKVLHEGLNTTELAAVYDDLSQEYDKVLTESKYYGPNTATDAVSKIIKPEERPQKIILDIGAGTGLVAEELTKKGFKVFDALDPSSGMLEKAREKGLYRNYIYEVIGSKPLNIPSGSYDVITVVGSHTKNHIKGEALQEMIRLLKSGGIICIVARMEGFYKFEEYKDSFFPLCDKLEKDGKWQKIECSECPYWNTLKGITFLYKVC